MKYQMLKSENFFDSKEMTRRFSLFFGLIDRLFLLARLLVVVLVTTMFIGKIFTGGAVAAVIFEHEKIAENITAYVNPYRLSTDKFDNIWVGPVTPDEEWQHKNHWLGVVVENMTDAPLMKQLAIVQNSISGSDVLGEESEPLVIKRAVLVDAETQLGRTNDILNLSQNTFLITLPPQSKRILAFELDREPIGESFVLWRPGYYGTYAEKVSGKYNTLGYLLLVASIFIGVWGGVIRDFRSTLSAALLLSFSLLALSTGGGLSSITAAGWNGNILSDFFMGLSLFFGNWLLLQILPYYPTDRFVEKVVGLSQVTSLIAVMFVLLGLSFIDGIVKLACVMTMGSLFYVVPKQLFRAKREHLWLIPGVAMIGASFLWMLYMVFEDDIVGVLFFEFVIYVGFGIGILLVGLGYGIGSVLKAPAIRMPEPQHETVRLKVA